MLTHIDEVLTSVVSKASSEIQNKDRQEAQASTFISPASNKTNKRTEGDHGCYEMVSYGAFSGFCHELHHLLKLFSISGLFRLPYQPNITFDRCFITFSNTATGVLKSQ